MMNEVMMKRRIRRVVAGSARRHRLRFGLLSRGYTLTELLVVVTIVVILVAATLPIAKRIMEDSRSRDSARILAGTLQMARTYAARNNRPFGLWFELAPVTAVPDFPGPTPPARTIRQCTRVYLAEVQQPYAGDTLGTSGAYVTIPVDPGPPPVTDFAAPWEITFLNASMLTASELLVAPGEFFRIRFDYRGQYYLGIRGTGASSGRFFLYGLGGPDGEFGVAGTDDDGNTVTDDASEHMAGGSDDLQMPVPPHNLQGNPPPPFHPFQVLRLPRRVGNPIELTAGTCIDLEYSGMGTTGTEFASANNYLVVMFSPKGEIDGLIGDGAVRGADGTLHFLVGQVTKINDPTATSATHGRTLFDPANANLSDVNSVWVSVGRQNGQVSTTENLVPPVDLAGAPANITIFPGEGLPPAGRRAVLTPGNVLHHQLYLQHCREVATNRDQMGGK